MHQSFRCFGLHVRARHSAAASCRFLHHSFSRCWRAAGAFVFCPPRRSIRSATSSPAALEIKATAAGPEFQVHIAGDRSGGISNMEIFCFDYALFKIATQRFGGPGILIHDSNLFADVDARQVATAIELGAELADELEVQYLVLMNSDEFAKLSFPAGSDTRSKILNVTIDDTDEGGLFGFKFG
ncbi:DUF2326 domain-containing protein [Rhizobium phaseoli]|uniref:DUF2326 domain-containing protein n=1 Tax=Rhizobium phaseoli TaxID=396 RepID=UPI00300229E0